MIQQRTSHHSIQHSRISPTEIKVTRALALLTVVAGMLLALSVRLLSTSGMISRAATGWPAPGSLDVAPTILSVGVPVALAAFWTVVALSYLESGRGKWLVGGLAAGAATCVLVATPYLLTLCGLDSHLALLLTGLEALVAGLWLADMLGYLSRNGIAPSLAAAVWLYMGVALFFPAALVSVVSILAAMLVVMPLCIVAMAGRNPVPVRSTPWLVAELLTLPLVLGASTLLAGLALGI
jgi:hypothetical protein